MIGYKRVTALQTHMYLDEFTTDDIAGQSFVPTPIPDGSGFVGFLDYNTQNMVISKEYVGACLNSNMIANTAYTLQVNVGFGIGTAMILPGFEAHHSPSPLELCLYGNPTCNQLPWTGQGCPTNYNGSQWIELLCVEVTGTAEWVLADLSFTPNQDINAVALGPNCGTAYGGQNINGTDLIPYYFLDNLILNTTEAFAAEPIEVSVDCFENTILSVANDEQVPLQWYENGVALIGETGDNLILPYDATGTYQAVFENDGSSCSLYEISLAPDNLPNYDITGDFTICKGGTTTITASGDFDNIYWDGVQGNNSQSFSEAGTYTLSLEYPNDCKVDTIFTIVEEVITIDIAGNLNICNGEETTLTVNGDFNAVYWDGVLGTTSATFNTGGTHTISVENALGCQTDTLITINEGAIAIDIAGDLEICTGEETMITVTGDFDEIYWDGLLGTPTQSFNTAGTHNILVNNAAGCETDTIITIKEYPEVSFSLSTENTINLLEGESQEVAVIVATPTDSYTVSWSPASDDLSCLDCEQQTITPTESGIYTVTVLDVTSNCSSSQMVSINLNSPNVFINVPTAFSPNNDGVNDKLALISNSPEGEFTELSFLIYNRWGKKVFETNNLHDAWDGAFKDGAAPISVYVYSLSYTNKKGQSITKKGNLTLIR